MCYTLVRKVSILYDGRIPVYFHIRSQVVGLTIIVASGCRAGGDSRSAEGVVDFIHFHDGCALGPVLLRNLFV